MSSGAESARQAAALEERAADLAPRLVAFLREYQTMRDAQRLAVNKRTRTTTILESARSKEDRLDAWARHLIRELEFDR